MLFLLVDVGQGVIQNYIIASQTVIFSALVANNMHLSIF
jgi:hypothetical protein